MTNLFNERALKQRYRVGDRKGAITLLSPPLKATLALGVAIAVGGGLWATLARIPLSVNGTGVLLPIGSITTSSSRSDGMVRWMFNQPVGAWQQQVWQFQKNPGSFNDQGMAKLARSILQAYEQPQLGSDGPIGSNSKSMLRYRGSKFEQGRLLIWVQSNTQKAGLSSALDQLERTLRKGAIQRRNIEAQQRVLRSEHASQSSYLASMKTLVAGGFVSRTTILQQQSSIDSIASQILDNDNQLIQLAAQQDQAYQNLRSKLVSLIEQQLIFADKTVYLDQANALNGEGVSSGQGLLKLSDQPLDGTILVPVFLSNNESAKVSPGMLALATPAGYRRAEVGGIRARVVFKARLPGDIDTVTARIGVPSLAQQILNQEPSPTLVMLALEREQGPAVTNSGGYRWSSQSSLPFAPTPGERLDVQITTRLLAPISLVLPTLKSWLGLTPPEAADTVGPGRS